MKKQVIKSTPSSKPVNRFLLRLFFMKQDKEALTSREIKDPEWNCFFLRKVHEEQEDHRNFSERHIFFYVEKTLTYC